jgi:hypothetical protein
MSNKALALSLVAVALLAGCLQPYVEVRSDRYGKADRILRRELSSSSQPGACQHYDGTVEYNPCVAYYHDVTRLLVESDTRFVLDQSYRPVSARCVSWVLRVLDRPPYEHGKIDLNRPVRSTANIKWDARGKPSLENQTPPDTTCGLRDAENVARLNAEPN